MSWTQILIASIGFGAGGEALRRYRSWKNRRRLIDYHTRNSGFWTDSRVNHAEAAFAAVALAPPFTFIIMVVGTNNSLLWDMAAVISYPLAIYLLLRGFNRDEPQ